MSDLLVLYDADDWLMRKTGSQRTGAEVLVGVTGGRKGLVAVLDGFVAEGKTFSRAVFHTHGNEGAIFFGDEDDNKTINARFLGESMADRRYDQLFPAPARIYLNGCKVSSGEKGWHFLETFGSIFLRRLGGEVFAHTSSSYPLLPYGLMLLGGLAGLLVGHSMVGHAPHVSGDARSVFFGPGGRVLGRKPDYSAAKNIVPDPMNVRPPM